MANLVPERAEAINRNLVDSVMENYERFYRFTYSLVKNEEQVKNILEKTIYFSLRNGRKLKSTPRSTIWFFQLIAKEGLNRIHDYKKYKRDFTYDSQIYAFMETLEPSKTNCFKLYYFEGFNESDTGEILRLKPEEVRFRLKEVRRTLRIQPDLGDDDSRGKMQELMDVYESVEIPEDLEKCIMDAIQKERREYEKLKKGIKRKRITKPLLLVLMLAAFFFGTIHIAQDNDSFREMVLSMPILKSLFAPFI